jgi:hypothetical protein
MERADIRFPKPEAGRLRRIGRRHKPVPVLPLRHVSERYEVMLSATCRARLRRLIVMHSFNFN